MEGSPLTIKRSVTKNGSSTRRLPVLAKAAKSIAAKSTQKLRLEKQANGNGIHAPAVLSSKKKFRLEPKLLLQIHDTMVKARVLEERLIRMYKQSDGYFWIGGPGEEAFNVPLGMNVKKGQARTTTTSICIIVRTRSCWPWGLTRST